MLKLFQNRRGYLYERLKAILVKRGPEEDEEIRNKYIKLAEEIEAEEAANIEE